MVIMHKISDHPTVTQQHGLFTISQWNNRRVGVFLASGKLSSGVFYGPRKIPLAEHSVPSHMLLQLRPRISCSISGDANEMRRLKNVGGQDCTLRNVSCVSYQRLSNLHEGILHSMALTPRPYLSQGSLVLLLTVLFPGPLFVSPAGQPRATRQTAPRGGRKTSTNAPLLNDKAEDERSSFGPVVPREAQSCFCQFFQSIT